MGHLQATEMAHLTNLDTALRWHLQANHYPPISLDFLPAAKRAIEMAENDPDNDLDTTIDLPNGKTLPVWKIVEGLHLQPFIDTEE